MYIYVLSRIYIHTKLIGLVLLLLSSTQVRSQKKIDSTLFGNKSYHFSLEIFAPVNFDESKFNSVFTFYKFSHHKKIIIRRDSLYCMNYLIDYADINNDKIKDLLIFHSIGARANPTYYLYLIDRKKLQLIKVPKFEELPNPYLDTSCNIIVSLGLAGSNYYSFYKLSKTNKLIMLLKDVEENPKDSSQYENIIKRLKKKK